MSIPAEKAAWSIIESEEFDLSLADKVVLLKIAFWANKDWECWHGTVVIAQATAVAVSTASDALQKLARYGLLKKRPRQKKEGRGRATNVIVFDPAADSDSLHINLDDQIRFETAADSDLDPQQIRDEPPGTNKGLERDLKEGLERGAAAGRDRRRKLPKINRHPVTEEEWDQAVAILDCFNARNGSKLRLLGKTGEPTDSMTRIIVRTRQHPELETDDYLRIIGRNFDAPWWDESKLGGVGPIFGPNAWPRALACSGVRKNSSGRKVRLDIDRPTTKEDMEDEPW